MAMHPQLLHDTAMAYVLCEPTTNASNDSTTSSACMQQTMVGASKHWSSMFGVRHDEDSTSKAHGPQMLSGAASRSILLFYNRTAVRLST
jgi:hypothetical protein